MKILTKCTCMHKRANQPHEYTCDLNLNQASKPKHTPTPWEIDEGDVRIKSDDYEVCRASDLPSSFGKYDYGDKGEEEQKANAEFIVRACNVYDELVEACKSALSALNSISSYDQESMEVKSLKQAIAKTEGK